MEWISFHGPRRPINGQKIIYYGEPGRSVNIADEATAILDELMG